MKKISYIILIVIALSYVSSAGVNAPYEVDAETLHLYHFDGNGNDAVSVNSINLSLDGGAIASDDSITGFGSAINTYDGVSGEGPAATAASNIYASNFMGDDGAFTFEAIIQPQVDLWAIPNEMEIISGEGDQTNDRGWQFRINTAGMVEFNNISVGGNNPNFALPSEGAHAYQAGQWYHVAVTYNGQENTAGNLKIYWTRLDANVDQAQLLGTFQMTGDIDASRRVDFVVGNEGRSTGGANENFEGLIDEVRISSIARGADEMLIASGEGAAVIITPPVDQIELQGQVAVFDTIFTSDTTPAIEWYKGSEDNEVWLDPADEGIDVVLTYNDSLAQYTATLTLSNLRIADADNYYCVISNRANWDIQTNPVSLYVQGVVGHWTLDYSRSDAGHYLEELGGYDAIVEGAASFVEGVDGTVAGAAVISNTDGWAKVPLHDILQQADAMTVSFWVNWFHDDGVMQDLLVEHPDGDALVMSNGLKADGGWQQVCLVFDGVTGKLYVDGLMRNEGAWQMPSDRAVSLNIGVGFDEQTPFIGAMDDIKMFNYALSDEQVADLRYDLSGNSSCILEYGSEYDLTGPEGRADCVVDLLDLAVLAGEFLASDSEYDLTGPQGSPDGVVDLNEMAGLSSQWLECGLYPVCE